MEELPADDPGTGAEDSDSSVAFTDDPVLPEHTLTVDQLSGQTPRSPYAGGKMLNTWHTFKFYIGLLTTALVFVAWTTNLVAKPLATAFGGTVTIIGMCVAYYTYTRQKRGELLPVVVTHTEEYMPGSILAVLVTGNRFNDAVVRSAIDAAKGRTIVFLYLGSRRSERPPNILEFHDPYYDNERAKKTFGRAERLAEMPR